MHAFDSKATEKQFHRKLDTIHWKIKVLKTPFTISWKSEKNISRAIAYFKTLCQEQRNSLMQVCSSKTYPWEFFPREYGSFPFPSMFFSTLPHFCSQVGVLFLFTWDSRGNPIPTVICIATNWLTRLLWEKSNPSLTENKNCKFQLCNDNQQNAQRVSNSLQVCLARILTYIYTVGQKAGPRTHDHDSPNHNRFAIFFRWKIPL